MMAARRSPIRVLAFAASLRAESLNARLAALAAEAVRENGGVADLISMREFGVPPYDGDLEAADGIPVGADRFRQRLDLVDGFIVASPEYNASMPGVLKNLIDWTSRHRPQPFNERHALLLSASPSMAGGNRPGLSTSARSPILQSIASRPQRPPDKGRHPDAELPQLRHAGAGTWTRAFRAQRESRAHPPAARRHEGGAVRIPFLGPRQPSLVMP
jgi:NAD(P)H-dependent FMN reductase